MRQRVLSRFQTLLQLKPEDEETPSPPPQLPPPPPSQPPRSRRCRRLTLPLARPATAQRRPVPLHQPGHRAATQQWRKALRHERLLGTGAGRPQGRVGQAGPGGAGLLASLTRSHHLVSCTRFIGSYHSSPPPSLRLALATLALHQRRTQRRPMRLAHELASSMLAVRMRVRRLG